MVRLVVLSALLLAGLTGCAAVRAVEAVTPEPGRSATPPPVRAVDGRPPLGAGFPGTAPTVAPDPYVAMLARLPRRSARALGTPASGGLLGGVRFPAQGPDHVTWDPITKQRPSRAWRRTGTLRAVRGTLRALRDLRRRRPGRPRVLVGDLSRPRGGDFGARFGILGHQTHQNGRDVDVYWPLRNRRAEVARGAAEVDQRAAAALVQALLRAGAARVLVGPGIRVRGPRVRVVAGHDDHAHATF